MALGAVSIETWASQPGLAVVLISGEVDLATAPTMHSHIAAALDQNSDILVDLSSATFIDSVALGELLLAQELCQAGGHELFVVITDQRVLRVFELTSLTSRFAIFDSRASLSAHIDERTGS